MKYTLNKSFVGQFENKLASFTNKFNKLGEGVIVYNKSLPYKRDKEIVVDIEVEGRYQIKDYVFVASLEWVEDQSVNLIKKISSEVFVPEIYRTRTVCDHCKVNRYRKHTVLLQNVNTKEYVQVGKSCVKDYLGVDIARYASYLSLWESLEEYYEALSQNNNGQLSIAWAVKEILGQTLEQVSRHGYISKNTAFECDCDSTARMVWLAMNHSTDLYGKLRYEEYEISDNSAKIAEDIIRYVNKRDNADNDYLFNLKTLLSESDIESDNFGLVVSAVGYYLRETEKDKERAKKESLPASKYIGDVGEKVEFRAIPKCVFSTENEYGWTYIYKFEIGNDTVIWKTNKSLDEDKEITLKATIKELSEYQGTKQTIVTRGRVI